MDTRETILTDEQLKKIAEILRGYRDNLFDTQVDEFMKIDKIITEVLILVGDKEIMERMRDIDDVPF